LLHITNGDTAVPLIRQVAPGEVLPWRDVLHEGPVRAGLPLEALSRERAAFIAECGWGSFKDVSEQFELRDKILESSVRQDEVVLWFEHDLYDQLQLIQLLDWFAVNRAARLSLVCEAEYLGWMKPARAAELFRSRRKVTDLELRTAQAAWVAFGSADPAEVELAMRRSQAIRFLPAALRRHLQEFPWTTDGNSLLERNVLDALRAGPLPFEQLFLAVREDPVFLGDTVLLWHLERMQREGLVIQRDGRWLLAGPRKARVARWLGGVKVDGDTPWRWDPGAGRLVRVA
jgi:hypothetical protein